MFFQPFLGMVESTASWSVQQTIYFFMYSPIQIENWSEKVPYLFGERFNLISMSPQNIVVRELYERLVKSFLDVIVLKKLKNGNPICGHEMRVFIHKRFHVLVPSGTIYSVLYSMERKGLIEGIVDRRKRVYRLTEKSKETLENISESSDKIVLLIRSILEK